jgi:lipid-binding SYLF domain-containing protein
MATSTNHRTPAQVRLEIESEREQLAGAVDHLRDEIRDATDIKAKVRAKLPVVTAGALTAGFVIAGGIGATMRMIGRHRERKTKARFGRFSLVDRD